MNSTEGCNYVTVGKQHPSFIPGSQLPPLAETTIHIPLDYSWRETQGLTYYSTPASCDLEDAGPLTDYLSTIKTWMVSKVF
jgi:hypothetical protein